MIKKTLQGCSLVVRIEFRALIAVGLIADQGTEIMQAWHGGEISFMKLLESSGHL